MSRPRPLNEKELQFLRRLAFRKGVPEHKYYANHTGSGLGNTQAFLAKRGLVEDVKHPCGTGIAITEKGMIEVAKSGRFTPYDPALVMERYSAILPKFKAKLSGMALRVVGLQEWWNPDEPWELIRNLTFLRAEDNLWRSSAHFAPMSLISDVQHWLEAELRGAEGYKDNLYEALVAELNKE